MYNGVKVFRTLLLDDTAVAASIGTRAYAIQRPQSSALPAIVLHQVSGDRTQSHGGRTAHTFGILQVDCLADDYTEAKALARAVERAATGYRGNIDGTPIRGVFLQNERDQRAETTTAGDPVFMVQLDFDVHAAEV